MRNYATVALLICVGAAPGQDAAVIVDRAIRAHGGVDNLAKLKFTTWTAKGRFNLNGVDVDARREAKWALPERTLGIVDMSPPGSSFRFAFGINGSTGWQRINNQPATDLTSFSMDVIAEEAYTHWLSQVMPLKQKGFTLTIEPEGTVDGLPTHVVKVLRQGKPDVQMHFSKTNGLLVKLNYRGREGGRPVSKETLFAEHKDFAGVRLPTKITDLKDGQRLGMWEVIEYKFPAKLEPDVFKKP